MRRILALGGALILSASCALASEYGDQLANLRTIYGDHLAKIESEAGKKLEAWPVSYTNGLLQLKTAHQQKGDLEGWQAVTTELKRFAEDAEITEDHLVTKPNDLRSLQTHFKDVVQKCSLDKSGDILSLTDKYVSRLEAVQKKLTIEGLMEDAIAYNAEIRRVKSSPTFTAAEFEVAAYEAAQARVERPVDNGPDGNAEPHPVTNTPTAPLPREGRLIGNCRVYPGNGPFVEGRRYKPLVLKATSRGRTLRKISVQARTAQQDSAGRNEWSGSRTDQTHTHLRVQLRTLSGLEVTAPIIAIQLFSRSVTRKGNVAPTQLAGHRVDLPALDASSLTVDCPAVKTAKWSESVYSSYSGSDKKGNEFYGTVITVFDSGGNMLYQAAAGNALDDLAPSDPPKLPTVSTEDPQVRLGRLEQVYYAAMREHRHNGGQELRRKMEEARVAYMEAKRVAGEAQDAPAED